MISPDFLKEHSIDMNSCFLYWLCGYELSEWLKLPSEKKHEFAKEWEALGRKYVKPQGSIRGETVPDDLRWEQDVEDQEIFREKYGQE